MIFIKLKYHHHIDVEYHLLNPDRWNERERGGGYRVGWRHWLIHHTHTQSSVIVSTRHFYSQSAYIEKNLSSTTSLGCGIFSATTTKTLQSQTKSYISCKLIYMWFNLYFSLCVGRRKKNRKYNVISFMCCSSVCRCRCVKLNALLLLHHIK